MPEYFLKPENILRQVNKNTALILIDNPNNPTGTMLPVGSVKTILENIPSTCILVLDEAYIDYADSIAKENLIPLITSYPNLLLLRSFSKIYGLAGLRVGYAIGTANIIRQLDYYQAPFTVNLPAQIAAQAAIVDVQFLNESKVFNARERLKLFQSLKNVGMPVIPSQSNFLFIPFTDLSKKDAFFTILDKSGIKIRNTDAFGALHGLRISVGTAEENQVIMQKINNTINTVQK